jgi:uncharacterized protein (TIGR00288 family)
VEPSPRSAATHAPNAALLIDFDNVTMGMRSDLSKELRNLLNSDVIKGKVAVQRAYADWRRYPQYIVPLAENSVDLIFAPAYGSSKKNATDIRMAIDGMELIFTRPEIGTFILLTGDSDFSSLVLKLKEYGKYVIGVGIQESSSDLLVQNCDEYYSYTALTGLRRAGDGEPGRAIDPWVLIERAVEQMIKRRDVMRSDRLKQVMLELDPGFDEGSLGYSKFSRFLTEASQKGLINLTKLDNGQYEVGAGKAGAAQAEKPSGERGARREEEPRRRERDRDRDRERDRDRDRERSREEAPRTAEKEPGSPAPAGEAPSAPGAAPSEDALRGAYDLLRKAVAALAGEEGAEGVRDSDVKRRMLALTPDFDEADLGFSKFSRFLRQAHDQEVIDLRKGENGIYEVALRTAGTARSAASPAGEEPEAVPTPRSEAVEEPESPPAETASGASSSARAGGAPSGADRRLQPRVSRRGARGDGPPPLLEGQVVEVPQAKSPAGEEEAAPAPRGRGGRGTRRKTPATREVPVDEVAAGSTPKPRRQRSGAAKAEAATGAIDPVALGLPTDPEEVVRHLTGYRGVGRKTAEGLVKAFAGDLFTVLNTDPSRVRNTVPVARAELVLEGWRLDLEQRRADATSGGSAAGQEAGPGNTADSEPVATASDAKEAGGGGRRRTRRGSRKGRGDGRAGGSGD